jgi:hypothetical protein
MAATTVAAELQSRVMHITDYNFHIESNRYDESSVLPITKYLSDLTLL